jgi:ATP-dependent DNA ligase
MRELFEAACRLDLEGIVAKRKADRYGPKTSWSKVKNQTYTQAEGRRELFERAEQQKPAQPLKPQTTNPSR